MANDKSTQNPGASDGTAGKSGNDTGNQDNPFTNIDPSTLSDELKAIYKNMQTDYQSKTTALADERKTLEADVTTLTDRVTVLQKANDDWSNFSENNLRPYWDDFQGFVKNKNNPASNPNPESSPQNQDPFGLGLNSGVTNPEGDKKELLERINNLETTLATEKANFTSALTQSNQGLNLLINAVKEGKPIDISNLAKVADGMGVDLSTAKMVTDAQDFSQSLENGDFVPKDKVQEQIDQATKVAIEEYEKTHASDPSLLPGSTFIPSSVFKKMGEDKAATHSAASEQTSNDILAGNFKDPSKPPE